MSVQGMLPVDSAVWIPVRDGDATVRGVFDRHYSRRCYTDGRSPSLFVGPGEKMVLRTLEADAIFVWRKFIDASGQHGVNCAVFRNEGPVLSSDLIRAAQGHAWNRWPGERLYTYVDAKRVRVKRNPGYCFLKAAWTYCGMTKGGLHILERLPALA